ncbi:hypothetical protein DPEC_G00325790 [Dallia pectoralis]|uniref:Uncharacterized protein n=1 Tax=Dallia pectoralis TaxID=75939 RepID=A0ACC2F7M4_DALPE|nr:hypothetical protein DPEC_G00325790 [Dallia pectoralis]
MGRLGGTFRLLHVDYFAVVVCEQTHETWYQETRARENRTGKSNQSGPVWARRKRTRSRLRREISVHTSSNPSNLEQEDPGMIHLPGYTDKLLTPPLINLIPPTPSDVIDNDQFFDDIISGERSVVDTNEPGSNMGVCVAGQEVEVEELKEERIDQERPEEKGSRTNTETQERQEVGQHPNLEVSAAQHRDNQVQYQEVSAAQHRDNQVQYQEVSAAQHRDNQVQYQEVSAAQHRDNQVQYQEVSAAQHRDNQVQYQEVSAAQHRDNQVQYQEVSAAQHRDNQVQYQEVSAAQHRDNQVQYQEVSAAQHRDNQVQYQASKKDGDTPSLLRKYQMAPLPDYIHKNYWNHKGACFHEFLGAELQLLPHYSTKMKAFVNRRKPGAARSCSMDETTRTVPRTQTLHLVYNPSTDHNPVEEGLPRQRRITVASYMPQSRDNNGNCSDKNSTSKQSGRLGELNTEELCQWFSSVGLCKCLPHIRESELRGEDVASIDTRTLEILHISNQEEREKLLSAIYRELHPPSTTSQTVDSLLETIGPKNIEKFTAALVSITRSKSPPQVRSKSSTQVSCLNMNQINSLKFSRCKSQTAVIQRNSQLTEITINASEQIVHLRTPRETLVGKVMESCLRSLGMTEDKDLYTLTQNRRSLGMTEDKDLYTLTQKPGFPGSSEELSPDHQIGDLLFPNNKQLELHLCRKNPLQDKPKVVVQPKVPEENGSQDNSPANQRPEVQVISRSGKEEKIQELKQQVDSLENVILEVQEIHQSLVAFCSELKRVDREEDVSGLSHSELEQHLEVSLTQLREKRQNLLCLRETLEETAVHGNKKSELRLLDKIKLNCQVFQEEISLVHLNRHVAHLQTALQDSQDKDGTQTQRTCSTLGQLVSLQCPAMLLAVQESCGPDGQFGFTCRLTVDSGLVVVQVDNVQSHLCLQDRLVEVNGVPVVGFSEKQLRSLLLQKAIAHMIVLRRPPPTPSPRPRRPPPVSPTPSTSSQEQLPTLGHPLDHPVKLIHATSAGSPPSYNPPRPPSPISN